MQLRQPIDGPNGPVTDVELTRAPALRDILDLEITTSPGDLDGEALAPIAAACVGLPPASIMALGVVDALDLFGAVLAAAAPAGPPASADPPPRYVESRRAQATTLIGLTAPIRVLGQDAHALLYSEPTLHGLRKIKLSAISSARPLAGVTYAGILPLYMQALGLSEAEALALSWADADRIAGVLLPLAFGAAPPTGG